MPKGVPKAGFRRKAKKQKKINLIDKQEITLNSAKLEIKVLQLLQKPKTFTELLTEVKCNEKILKQMLKTYINEDLIVSVSEGKKVFYSLSDL